MSKRLVRQLFFFIILVIPGFPGITLFASDFSAVDSSHVTVRQPAPEFVDSYRSQSEFNYSIPPLETNFFMQLWDYLLKRFRVLLDLSAAMPLIYKILLWVCVIFTLFIAITKTQIYKLFYSDKEFDSPDYQLSNTIDQSIDFDEAIRLQMTQHQYRLAIRLLYLKMINHLRIKEYIHFSKEKTNVDYLSDLTNNDLKLQFITITSIYNHVWYGDVEIAEDQYLRFEARFNSFYTAIDAKE